MGARVHAVGGDARNGIKNRRKKMEYLVGQGFQRGKSNKRAFSPNLGRTGNLAISGSPCGPRPDGECLPSLLVAAAELLSPSARIRAWIEANHVEAVISNWNELFEAFRTAGLRVLG